MTGNMRFYLAPMEGITGYVYRGAYHRFFSPMDRYYTPFIVPNQNRSLKTRELSDLLLEHNLGMAVVPQVMTNRAEDFIWTVGKLREMGYGEVNLNLGCPSGTVVSKGRGAGFLAEPEALERFFDQVFSADVGEISVKTRLGMRDPAEFERLMGIFNRFPIRELVIHPRVREDFYRNRPCMEAFAYGLETSRCPVCYNGDLFSVEAFAAVTGRFPGLEAVMLGRGVIANPFLPGLLRGEEPEDARGRLRAFHGAVYEGYRELMPGDRNTLFKMKELWAYMGCLFEGGERYLKKIKKAERRGDYEAAVDGLFSEGKLRERAGFCPAGM